MPAKQQKQQQQTRTPPALNRNQLGTRCLCHQPCQLQEQPQAKAKAPPLRATASLHFFSQVTLPPCPSLLPLPPPPSISLHPPPSFDLLCVFRTTTTFMFLLLKLFQPAGRPQQVLLSPLPTLIQPRCTIFLSPPVQNDTFLMCPAGNRRVLQLARCVGAGRAAAVASGAIRVRGGRASAAGAAVSGGAHDTSDLNMCRVT